MVSLSSLLGYIIRTIIILCFPFVACFDVHPASATVSAGGWTMFNCSGPAGTHFRWFGENDASDPFTRVHLDSNNSPLSTEDYNVSTETHGQNAVSYLWIRGNWQTYQTVRLVQCRARCHCDNTAGVTVEYSKAAEFRVVDLPQPPPAMQPTDAASSFTENTLSVGQSRKHMQRSRIYIVRMLVVM